MLTLLPDDFTFGISAVAWSPDGSRIVAFSDDRLGRVWMAHTGELVGTFLAEVWDFVAQWSPSSGRFLVGGRHGVRVWDATTLQVTNCPEVISSRSLSLSIWLPNAMVWAPAPSMAFIALLARTPLPTTTAVAGGTLTTPPITRPRPPWLV